MLLDVVTVIPMTGYHGSREGPAGVIGRSVCSAGRRENLIAARSNYVFLSLLSAETLPLPQTKTNRRAQEHPGADGRRAGGLLWRVWRRVAWCPWALGRKVKRYIRLVFDWTMQVCVVLGAGLDARGCREGEGSQVVRGKGKERRSSTPGQAVTVQRYGARRWTSHSPPTGYRKRMGLRGAMGNDDQWRARDGLKEFPFPHSLSLFSITSSACAVLCSVP
ncbi:uncharacterized protein BDZ83DRAFT_601742 [Colletotrichum acutatum]|uniref:Uncharacterized protein n=1 Tax=Glomerella acutata TaxID=27357 RepID=A0AAD8XNM4_GLOAC|nr:uncharacterized protein BDZ83DRAFT_601742 [Colletotrichum acutatum]KAK1730608.1 hypothetical protein BDZ83DRAFT_601742 [Colletotrichum acutatum]